MSSEKDIVENWVKKAFHKLGIEYISLDKAFKDGINLIKILQFITGKEIPIKSVLSAVADFMNPNLNEALKFMEVNNLMTEKNKVSKNQLQNEGEKYAVILLLPLVEQFPFDDEPETSDSDEKSKEGEMKKEESKDRESKDAESKDRESKVNEIEKDDESKDNGGKNDESKDNGGKNDVDELFNHALIDFHLSKCNFKDAWEICKNVDKITKNDPKFYQEIMFCAWEVSQLKEIKSDNEKYNEILTKAIDICNSAIKAFKDEKCFVNSLNFLNLLKDNEIPDFNKIISQCYEKKIFDKLDGVVYFKTISDMSNINDNSFWESGDKLTDQLVMKLMKLMIFENNFSIDVVKKQSMFIVQEIISDSAQEITEEQLKKAFGDVQISDYHCTDGHYIFKVFYSFSKTKNMINIDGKDYKLSVFFNPTKSFFLKTTENFSTPLNFLDELKSICPSVSALSKKVNSEGKYYSFSVLTKRNDLLKLLECEKLPSKIVSIVPMDYALYHLETRYIDVVIKPITLTNLKELIKDLETLYQVSNGFATVWINKKDFKTLWDRAILRYKPKVAYPFFVLADQALCKKYIFDEFSFLTMDDLTEETKIFKKETVKNYLSGTFSDELTKSKSSKKHHTRNIVIKSIPHEGRNAEEEVLDKKEVQNAIIKLVDKEKKASNEISDGKYTVIVKKCLTRHKITGNLYSFLLELAEIEKDDIKQDFKIESLFDDLLDKTKFGVEFKEMVNNAKTESDCDKIFNNYCLKLTH